LVLATKPSWVGGRHLIKAHMIKHSLWCVTKKVVTYCCQTKYQRLCKHKLQKKIDFKGKDLYIGLDVHKKSWSVTILVEGMEHRTFTQPPDPLALYTYLQRMFPGGTYYSAYEAGFCGYGIHRALNDLG